MTTVPSSVPTLADQTAGKPSPDAILFSDDRLLLYGKSLPYHVHEIAATLTGGDDIILLVHSHSAPEATAAGAILGVAVVLHHEKNNPLTHHAACALLYAHNLYLTILFFSTHCPAVR